MNEPRFAMNLRPMPQVWLDKLKVICQEYDPDFIAVFALHGSEERGLALSAWTAFVGDDAVPQAVALFNHALYAEEEGTGHTLAETPTTDGQSVEDAERLIDYLTTKHVRAAHRSPRGLNEAEVRGIVATTVADTLLVADGSLTVEDFKP